MTLTYEVGGLRSKHFLVICERSFLLYCLVEKVFLIIIHIRVYGFWVWKLLNTWISSVWHLWSSSTDVSSCSRHHLTTICNLLGKCVVYLELIGISFILILSMIVILVKLIICLVLFNSRLRDIFCQTGFNLLFSSWLRFLPFLH